MFLLERRVPVVILGVVGGLGAYRKKNPGAYEVAPLSFFCLPLSPKGVFFKAERVKI